MSTVIRLINELIDRFKQHKLPTNLLPSLESKLSNPYSLQCLIDWIYNIEKNNQIIVLDFDKIENDLQELQSKYGTKCRGLFYPNIECYYGEYYNQNSKMYNADRQILDNIYKKMFGDMPSIIHYILYNKSFLFELNKPDVNREQIKLDYIIATSGDLIKFNMKQSINILRLLLFKYQIINIDANFEEDNATFLVDIEEAIRERIVTNTFLFDDIKQLYLNLLMDIYSISPNKNQLAIINVFVENDNNYCIVNFFENIYLKYNCNTFNTPNKLCHRLLKQLLFRGIPPFQIRQNIYTNDKIITNQFNDIYNTLTNDIRVEESYEWNGVPMIIFPVFVAIIICKVADEAKEEMYALLDKYLSSIITDDCIQCIVSFIYMNWNKLLPKVVDQNIMRKMENMYIMD
eukprot:314661_1